MLAVIEKSRVTSPRLIICCSRLTVLPDNVSSDGSLSISRNESNGERAGVMCPRLVAAMASGDVSRTVENGWTSSARYPGVLALATLLATAVWRADSHSDFCDATRKR